MSRVRDLSSTIPHGRGGLVAGSLLFLAAAAGLGLAVGVERLPEETAGLLPVVLAFLGVALVLSVGKPETLVLIGFALLVFVRQEPAPVDIVFAVLILAALFSRRQWLKLPQAVSLLLVALAAVTILSMVNAAGFRDAVRFEIVTLYLLALGAWLTGVFANAELARRAMTVYIVAAALSALVAVVALQVGFPGRSYLVYGSGDLLRAQALFKDPNVFAPFLVPAAAIVLEEIARPRLLDWRLRWKVATFVILAAGVVFAFSRGAWLNMAVALSTVILIYTIRRRGLRRAAKAGIVVLAAGLVGFSLLLATGSLRFFESRSLEQAYDQQRFGTQGEAFNRVTDHLLGYGPGQVETFLARSAHSLYVRLAFEQGLIGAFVLFLLIAVTTVFAVSLVARDRDVHGVGSVALLGAWLGLLVNSLVIDTLHWRHLWIVAALIWAGYALSQRRPAAEQAVRGFVWDADTGAWRRPRVHR